MSKLLSKKKSSKIHTSGTALLLTVKSWAKVISWIEKINKLIWTDVLISNSRRFLSTEIQLCLAFCFKHTNDAYSNQQKNSEDFHFSFSFFELFQILLNQEPKKCLWLIEKFVGPFILFQTTKKCMRLNDSCNDPFIYCIANKIKIQLVCSVAIDFNNTLELTLKKWICW